MKLHFLKVVASHNNWFPWISHTSLKWLHRTARQLRCNLPSFKTNYPSSRCRKVMG